MDSDASDKLIELRDEAMKAGWKPPYETARKLLALMRKRQTMASPSIVAAVSEHLLSIGSTSLGDEYWTVLEQQVEAMVRLRRFKKAEKGIRELQSRFPSSSRVSRLLMLHEECLMAADRGGKSMELLEEDLATSLEAHEASRALSQRRCAIARLAWSKRVSGGAAEAVEDGVVESLRTHVRIHTEDQAGWASLAHALAYRGRYQEAAFCYEELILLARGNPHFHCRLAECMATYASGRSAGDILAGARRHAAAAVRLSHGLLPRAVLVLQQITQTLNETKPDATNSKELLETSKTLATTLADSLPDSPAKTAWKMSIC